MELPMGPMEQSSANRDDLGTEWKDRWTEWNPIRTKRNNLWSERNALRTKRNNLWSERNLLRARGNPLSSERNVLRAKLNDLWTDGTIQGPNEQHWNQTEQHLEEMELFERK